MTDLEAEQWRSWAARDKLEQLTALNVREAGDDAPEHDDSRVIWRVAA